MELFTRLITGLDGRRAWLRSPFFTTPFILTYGYNLLGEIASLTLPSQLGTSLTYVHDKAGRLTTVTGAGYVYNNSTSTQVPISSFMSNAVYRAWNDLKQMSTGGSSQTSFSYDQNLQPTSYNLTAGNSSYTWNYHYYADGSTRSVSDTANNQFDKAFSYDHVGRMSEAYSGREARGYRRRLPTPTVLFGRRLNTTPSTSRCVRPDASGSVKCRVRVFVHQQPSRWLRV